MSGLPGALPAYASAVASGWSWRHCRPKHCEWNGGTTDFATTVRKCQKDCLAQLGKHQRNKTVLKDVQTSATSGRLDNFHALHPSISNINKWPSISKPWRRCTQRSGHPQPGQGVRPVNAKENGWIRRPTRLRLPFRPLPAVGAGSYLHHHGGRKAAASNILLGWGAMVEVVIPNAVLGFCSECWHVSGMFGIYIYNLYTYCIILLNSSGPLRRQQISRCGAAVLHQILEPVLKRLGSTAHFPGTKSGKVIFIMFAGNSFFFVSESTCVVNQCVISSHTPSNCWGFQLMTSNASFVYNLTIPKSPWAVNRCKSSFKMRA